jgi:hypothetical protein
MPSRRTRVVLYTSAFMLFAPRSALAMDRYVDAAAAAGGDGSQAKPFKTIAGAVGVMSRGDTVWLATGTYDEVVNVAKLTGSGTTTFRALPGAAPVISGASGSAAAGFVVQTSVPGTVFQDLTIADAMSGALGVQFYYADDGQVIHCVTKAMSGNAVTFYYSNRGTVSGSTCQGNIAGRQTTGTVVEDNEVYGSSAEGVGLYDGSTQCVVAHNVIHDNYSVNLYLDGISHSTFDANLIYETDASNDLEGIEIADEGHYADLPAPVNAYNTITNNVIVGNHLGIVYWYSGEWSTQALNDQSGLRYDVIANNTLVDNAGSFKWDASPAHVGTIIEDNLVVAAGTSPLYLVQAKSTAGIALDHNLWDAPDLAQPFLWVNAQVDHAGFVAMSGQGAGDVTGDPKLVGPWSAPPATNLALAMGSPAIAAGSTVAAVTHDYLGAPRPATGTDIGAFQYGAVAPTDAGASSVESDGSGGATGSSGAGGDAGSAAAVASDAGAFTETRDAGDASPGSGDASSGCSCAHAGVDVNRHRSLEDAFLLAAAVGLALGRRSRRSSRQAWASRSARDDGPVSWRRSPKRAR